MCPACSEERRRRLENRPGTPPTGRREPVPAHSLPRCGGSQPSPGCSCVFRAGGPSAHQHGPRARAGSTHGLWGRAPSLLPAGLSGHLRHPRPWQLGEQLEAVLGGWGRSEAGRYLEQTQCSEVTPRSRRKEESDPKGSAHPGLSLSPVPTASVPRARACVPSFALGTQ